MALMHTPAGKTGANAPDFTLKATDGNSYSLQDIKGENGTLVAFICNHCPYVKAIVDRLVADAGILQDHGIGVIAIMPNDTDKYPDDSFENMKKFAKTHGFSFPYVIDKNQETARAYGAVCTPDFFGYDKNLKLAYRGRLDEVNPSTPATPATEKELLNAMLAVAGTGKAPENQVPSMGCSIKWKEEAA